MVKEESSDLLQMIYESAKYPMQCFWFTTLVSKQSHLSSIYIEQQYAKVNLAQNSRIIAWTFFECQQNSGSLNSQMMQS
jgi:23S rRNA (adenine1618-N6)-methyltransferase